MMRVSVIIPVYNELESVTETAIALDSALNYLRSSYDVELILVDDGSQDGTDAQLAATFAGKPDVHLLRHEQNQGIGAALRTGFATATGDVLVTTDFDGTYPFTAIPQIVGRLQVMKADVVVASPYHPYGSVQEMEPNQQFLGRAASLIYRIFINRNVSSWTSLFCAYQRRVLDRITFQRNDALASTELLVNAIQGGFSVSELPVRLKARAHGQTHVGSADLTARHLLYLASLPVQRMS